MTAGGWTYPAELADALARFGLAPTPRTPPGFVRDALSDLYRFEIRRLRDARRDGRVAKEDYVGRVIALRKKYWPLALTAGQWQQVCEPVNGAVGQ